MEETKSTALQSPCILSSVSVEARFADFCKNKLALDENTQKKAMKLLQETKQLLLTTKSSIGSGTPEQVEQLWFALVLFSVKRLGQGNMSSAQKELNSNAYTLCQVLRAAKLNLVDFFQELPQFAVRTAPVLSTIYGKDWENRLEAKELQANFVHLSLLSKHYRRAFCELFSSSDASASRHSNGVNLKGYLSNCHHFGWLLFLALRDHTANRFKDLVTCIIGLVSILAILIIHIPVHFRNFSIHDSSRFVKKDDKAVDLIASLCKMYDASEEDLRESLEKANKLIENILHKIPLAASQCESENLENVDKDKLICFEDLLESSSLLSNIHILERYYEDAVHNSGELDERVFINEEHILLGSEGLLAGTMKISCIKKKLDSIASPARTITSPLSPYRSPAPHSNHNAVSNLQMAATPVSTAMTTAKWLRTVISPLPSKPSAGLERFLTTCNRDITGDVICRAQIILDAIFPSSALEERCISGNLLNANLVDNVWAQQRRMEALKLYYRVLEATCRAEIKLNDGSNLTNLLMNERFQRCMLACSAELVLATHKTVSTLFPVVLERTGITAFDICRVIEIFIRNEEYLPRELKRHLNSLEERLLESMVWQKGSTLYNYLTVANPGLSAEIDRLGLLAEPMPSLDAIATKASLSCGGLPPVLSSQKNEALPGQNGDIRSPKRLRSSFTSPVSNRPLALGNLKSKPSPLKLQSTFASPAKSYPGGGGDTCAENGIKLIFSKNMKLAALRIAGMVEKLQLLQQIKEGVYSLFQKILNQRTSLFFKRHVDQIILCCFYGVAKIKQLNLTFKEIINNYKKLPHCKPQVYHSVFVDWSFSCRNGKAGQEYVDIITFYNDFFVPAVKPLLQELAILATPSKASQNTNDAPFPESPKVTHFPNLPDISPKKVSPAQNVYVSPLRSSKMDVLVSPTSKSYYACLGESTSAYRSPSKDLSAINICLNRPTKRRTALKFDGADVGFAIKDSLVASSLYMDNESSARSLDDPSERPTKRKQLES